MQPLVVRDYAPADLTAVVELFGRSVRVLGARDYSPEQLAAWAPEPPDLERWRQRLSGGAVFVCEVEQRVAGFARAEESGLVDLLYVDPQAARRGVARALLSRIAAWAQERGIARLRTDASLTARSFFERAGFVVMAEQNVRRGSVALRNFRMETATASVLCSPRDLRLRPAGPQDAGLLRRWDDEPHVVASDPNDDWQWETELARSPDWREQLIAELDGRPIGFVQIIDPAREDSRYWGDVPAGLRAIDIWIGEQDARGQGCGTRMMRLALERCFADPGVSAVLIDPLAGNTRAHRFYERLGFRFVERRRFGQDDCFVYRLDRPEFK